MAKPKLPPHIEWLQAQAQELARGVERAGRDMHRTMAAAEVARREFAASLLMLRKAMEDAGLTYDPSVLGVGPGQESGRAPTIAELAAQAILEKGELTSGQIRDYLAAFGKKATTNTVTVTLNRHKERFRRVDDGKKWALREQ
jgi:hypothetical protein